MIYNMSAVNNPSHYNNGNIECIDAIEASMTSSEFQGFLKGNIMKYLWRYKSKEKQKEDLEKSSWYMTRLQNSIKHD